MGLARNGERQVSQDNNGFNYVYSILLKIKMTKASNLKNCYISTHILGSNMAFQSIDRQSVTK